MKQGGRYYALLLLIRTKGVVILCFIIIIAGEIRSNDLKINHDIETWRAISVDLGTTLPPIPLLGSDSVIEVNGHSVI